MSIVQGQKHFARRKNTIAGIFLFVVLLLIARLFFLQVINHTYKLSASSNVIRHITDYPARGLIYDRHGDLLVYNEAHYDLMVIPIQVRDIDTTAFCDLLGIDTDTYERLMAQAIRHSRFRPSLFRQQISKSTFAAFQENLYRFPGFFVQPRTLRRYAHPMAAHTFGYVGEAGPEVIRNSPYYRRGDYIGISGLERAYEEELRGRKGVRIRMVDVLNRDAGPYQQGRYDTLSVPGLDLHTTLDAPLQLLGEKLMQNKRGSIVAIEPGSGEILALVTSPAYDPNLLVGQVRTPNYRMLQNDTLKPLFNRALMAQYPPGSVFKVVNTLIAMQEGVIGHNTSYACNGAYYSGRITVRCRSHPSPVNVFTSIQHSCNTFSCITFRNTLDKPAFSSIQQGFNTWRDHVSSFGFGQVFNSDLSFELRGHLATSGDYDRIYGNRGWSSLTIISLAIGQGEIGTTPLQLANLAATIANRGHYLTPHLVKAIGSPDQANERYNQQHHTSIDSVHFEIMAEAMHRVVTEGTGQFSRIPGIEMAGKTGTVQNPHGENHSVFIAFAPVENPRIAVSVVIENAGYGSTWAAPVASLMIEQYLNGTTRREWFKQRILDATF